MAADVSSFTSANVVRRFQSQKQLGWISPWIYTFAPDIFTIHLPGDSLLDGVVTFCFSPQTVGAYRIRPDVSEKG